MQHRPINYFPHIDGLRAIAVISVVLHHLSVNLMPGGYVGVDIFFVISGYLISGIIINEIKEGKFKFSNFYERRVRRIFPALFAVLISISIFGFFVFLPSDYNSILKGISASIFFISNIFFWRELSDGYFAAMDIGINPVLHMWSLSVEEQFYIFFPIFLVIFYKTNIKKKYLIILIIFMLAVSFLGSEYFLREKRVAVFFLSPFRAWELLAGVLLAFNIFPKLKSLILNELIFLAGILAILYSCFFYTTTTRFPGLSALAPILGSMAIIYAGKNTNLLSKKILEIWPVVYIGLISYSLYLWHWPIIIILRFTFPDSLLFTNVFFLLLISLIISSFSYHYIEQPFRGSEGKLFFSRRLLILSSLFIIFLLLFFTLVGISKNGYEKRFSEEIVSFDKARMPDLLFKHCDNKSSVENWCHIGDIKNPADTIFIGDSHLLSWAPVLDLILQKRNKSAILSVLSACPPIFRIYKFGSNFRKNGSACIDHSFNVEKFIKNNSKIVNVVLVGYWSQYSLNDDNFQIINYENKIYKSNEAVKQGLQQTIFKLIQYNKKIIILGPVPFYKRSVPLEHAISLKNKKKYIADTKIKQRQKNIEFFKIIDNFLSNESIYYANPLDWMCDKDCITLVDGKSIYWDNSHLNNFGALSFETQFNKSLNFFYTEEY